MVFPYSERYVKGSLGERGRVRASTLEIVQNLIMQSIETFLITGSVACLWPYVSAFSRHDVICELLLYMETVG